MTRTISIEYAEFRRKLKSHQSEIDSLKANSINGQALKRRVIELEEVVTQVLAGMLKQLDFDQTLAARINRLSEAAKDRDSQPEIGD